MNHAQFTIGDKHFECSWPEGSYTISYVADKIAFEARMMVEGTV